MQDRLEAAEAGFLDLSSALLRAPDPVPLLRAHASLLRSAASARGSDVTYVIAASHSVLSHSSVGIVHKVIFNHVIGC